jgi:hypothetical protein
LVNESSNERKESHAKRRQEQSDCFKVSSIVFVRETVKRGFDEWTFWEQPGANPS